MQHRLKQQQALMQQALLLQQQQRLSLYAKPGLLAAPQIEPILSGNLPPEFDPSTCGNVYVGSVHIQATEALLQEVFQSTGPVEGCKLIRKEKIMPIPSRNLPSGFNPSTCHCVLPVNRYFSFLQKRLMTKHRRVQDRSKKKRVHYLENATECWKVASKILTVIGALKEEPEQVAPLSWLERYRQKLSLSPKHKVKDFVEKSPKLFELYKDQKGRIWCGLTEQAEDLVEQEARLLEEHSEKAAEYVTRLLMMSVDKILPVDKITPFRRDMGLPHNFRKKWIYMFPELFKVVHREDKEYLQLMSWNPSWAVTELEKKAVAAGFTSDPLYESGVLCLPFPMKFPPDYKVFRHGGSIEHFQKRPYLSPYTDGRGLTPGSQEYDKRAVAIMHEILSFTIEKRLVTDHLTNFRREFVMPQKLMRLLLKHFGIFYVSERGKRFSVFLTEAYDGSELMDKCPLFHWREKILRLTGYRGRRKRIKSFNETSDSENYFIGDNQDIKDDFMEDVDDSHLGALDEADDSEMDVREVNEAYEH